MKGPAWKLRWYRLLNALRQLKRRTARLFNVRDMHHCIYCDKRKPVEEFSLEHIFPDALGGRLCGDLFKTRRVCRSCNSTCGLWVDAPFLKGWFNKNAVAEAARQFLDWSRPSPLPLNYIGVLPDMPVAQGEYCEYWLGPCGESIYHFHVEPGEGLRTLAGGDPRTRKKMAGTAVIVFTSSQPHWIRIALESFREAFPHSRRLALNADSDDQQHYIDVPNGDERKLIDHLKSIHAQPGLQHRAQARIQVGLEQRFLAKIALGMGFKLLGEQFLRTPYSKVLRVALWEKDRKCRSLLPIRGTGFLSGKPGPNLVPVAIEGVHTVLFMPAGEVLGLGLWLYGREPMFICLSDDPSLWQHLSDIATGIVYLIQPERKVFIGPIAVPEFLAHQVGTTRVPEIDALERMRIDLSTLPPC